MGLLWFVGAGTVVMGIVWEARVIRKHFDSDVNVRLMKPVGWTFAIAGAVANALAAFLPLPAAVVFGFTLIGAFVGLFGSGLLAVRGVAVVSRKKQSRPTWSVVFGFALSAAGFIVMTYDNLAPYM
ncbi:hypothetical protein ACO03V_05960 [Microbacterium sp. HMH0099]|uniref:hypothetical protein n=1 Tax=Microbacterium sp. HMH0099 TaxID=3414026 RepID=UPI003BF6854F